MNHTDSAKQYLQERGFFADLTTEARVELLMTEFAESEAKEFAEFIHENARISPYFPNIWDCVTDGQEYTHTLLYNKFKEERGK